MAFNRLSPLTFRLNSVFKSIDAKRTLANTDQEEPNLKLVGIYSESTSNKVFDPVTDRYQQFSNIISTVNIQSIANSTYLSGSSICGVLQLPSISRTSNGSGFIQSVSISSNTDLSNVSFVCTFLDSIPSANISDNTSVAFSSNDIPKIFAAVKLSHGDCLNLGSNNTLWYRNNLTIPFSLKSGSNSGFLVIQSEQSSTFANNTLNIQIGVVQS